jgi:hypothetical protein
MSIDHDSDARRTRLRWSFRSSHWRAFPRRACPFSEKLPPVRERSCRAATAPYVVPFRDEAVKSVVVVSVCLQGKDTPDGGQGMGLPAGCADAVDPEHGPSGPGSSSPQAASPCGGLKNPKSFPLTELVSIRRLRVKVRPGSSAANPEPLPPELAPARARGFTKKPGLSCQVPPTGVACPAGVLPLPVCHHEGEL